MADCLEPTLAVSILASGAYLPRGHHYFDHPEDGVHGDAGSSEVHDLMLGDPVAFVGEGDVMVDFVDRASIRSC